MVFFFASVWGESSDKFITPSYLERSLSGAAFLPNVTAQDLRTFVFSFKANKAPGVDNIRSWNLRKNFDTLVSLLLYVLNGIISSGIITVGVKKFHFIKEVREKV